ncbi:DUF1569 domain-containing protein [Granulicella sp. dw_53]|uniref:DUF1569 domain-containing protein n=1 Tax=Granulicella sp. dw_53 TaxID=2719792 RepID=UPI001BD36903|nr:DUF1569 domain-containing protein [Granulicella sp. dw_53]
MKSLASADVLSETAARLRSVSVDDRALWGRMTATKMVRHLGHAFEMALGERMVEPVKGVPPTVMKWMALRSGFRWPKDYATPPDLLRAVQESCGEEFEVLRCSAMEKMERMVRASDWAATHPILGSMTEKDWMRWGYLHTDHHLRQFGR